MVFKSGFVSIIGTPNAGKSTLLNALTEFKLAITSDKPQTTRNTIKAVITKEDFQMVIIDTPGIHRPKSKLGEYMVKKAMDTLNEVDIVVYIVDSCSKKINEAELNILENIKNTKNTKKILLLNKIDLLKSKDIIPERITEYTKYVEFDTVIPISALENDGIDIVLNEMKKILPEGPKYYPEDTLTDQPERVIAGEIIREKMLELLSDEIPHGIGIEIMTFREREDKELLDIEANIFCEKESHKRIIIGKRGSMIGKIGEKARIEIERFVGIKVYLNLWVKVKKDWRNNNNMLKDLGYS